MKFIDEWYFCKLIYKCIQKALSDVKVRAFAFVSAIINKALVNVSKKSVSERIYLRSSTFVDYSNVTQYLEAPSNLL